MSTSSRTPGRLAASEASSGAGTADAHGEPLRARRGACGRWPFPGGGLRGTFGIGLGLVLGLLALLLPGPVQSTGWATEHGAQAEEATPQVVGAPGEYGARADGASGEGGTLSVGEARTPPLPPLHIPARRDLPATQILDPDRVAPGSLAFGRTNEGRLIGGRALAFDAPTSFVLREHRARGTNHTSDALATIVEEAAAHLNARFPDARLSLGNLSAPDGGRFRWSRSHQNGLDGDIGFVFTNRQGQVVEAPTLYHVRPNLEVRQRADLVFDVPRNWALVEGLLLSAEADVQWLFISLPLKAALLEHARQIGADPEIIRRASIVLHQPGDSLPHDDHFHLRIACPPRDAIEGCVHWGPRRDWWPSRDQRRTLRVEELLEVMGPDAAEAREIAEAARAFLIAMEPRDQAVPIAMGLAGIDAEHRPALLHLLRALDQAGIAEGVLAMVRVEEDPGTRALALRTLGRVGDEGAAEALVALVGDRQEDPVVRVAAARALRTLHPGLRTFQPLPQALARAESDGQEELVDAIDHLLRRQTGVRAPEGMRSSHFWGWFVVEQRETPELVLRILALRDAGYGVGAGLIEETTPQEVRQLLAALGDERDEVSYSAHRVLRAHAGVWSPLDPGSANSRIGWWERRLPARMLREVPQAALPPR